MLLLARTISLLKPVVNLLYEGEHEGLQVLEFDLAESLLLDPLIHEIEELPVFAMHGQTLVEVPMQVTRGHVRVAPAMEPVLLGKQLAQTILREHTKVLCLMNIGFVAS